MAKLKIKARIFYPPGPWGLNKPVEGAKVTIHDLDVNGEDKIFTDTSDQNGRIRGTSKDWQDKTRIRYWHVRPGFPPVGEWRHKSVPDPTDVMALTIEVKADGKTMTVPFPFVGDNVEVPIVVTWGYLGGRNLGHGRINGSSHTDFQSLVDAATQTIDDGDPLELTLYGSWSESVKPLLDTLQTPPLELMQNLFPGTASGSVIVAVGGLTVTLTAAQIVAIILSVGGVILMTGAAVFVTALGIAVVYAISRGYCNIEAGQDTVQDPLSGQPTNRTRIKLSMDC
ncbi:MAG: hypothetical protein AAGG01_18180 [Planctomycetota bacterium]